MPFKMFSLDPMYCKQTRVGRRDELGAITAVQMREKDNSEQETTYEEIDSKVA